VGAKQKRHCLLEKGAQYFSAGYLSPFRMHSYGGQLSIQKSWSCIQQETNKFYTTTDHVVSRPASGLGVDDVVMAGPSLNTTMFMDLQYQKQCT
jgi:hypothetical protein